MRTFFIACICLATTATGQNLKPISLDEDVGLAPPPSPQAASSNAAAVDADVDAVFAAPAPKEAPKQAAPAAPQTKTSTADTPERKGPRVVRHKEADEKPQPKAPKLLPADPRGETLPAAVSHAKAESTPLLWKDTPLEEALDEIARFRGVEIRYMRGGTTGSPKVNGDHRATDTHSLIRTLAMQSNLSFEFANGVYTLSGTEASKMPIAAQPPQPLTNSRLYAVAPNMAPAFLNAYLQVKNAHGRLTFVGATAEGQNSYRIVDSPATLDRMSDSLASMVQERSRAAANLQPLSKEREKLLKKRSKLVQRYMQQQD